MKESLYGIHAELHLAIQAQTAEAANGVSIDDFAEGSLVALGSIGASFALAYGAKYMVDSRDIKKYGKPYSELSQREKDDARTKRLTEKYLKPDAQIVFEINQTSAHTDQPRLYRPAAHNPWGAPKREGDSDHRGKVCPVNGCSCMRLGWPRKSKSLLVDDNEDFRKFLI